MVGSSCNRPYVPMAEARGPIPHPRYNRGQNRPLVGRSVMPQEPGKIRNVAVLGHRGSGKTSLVESLLFQAGAINRLGSVADGTTVGYDDDEKRRSLTISCTVLHADWHERRLNVIDTPGDPSFQGDALGPLRVV